VENFWQLPGLGHFGVFPERGLEAQGIADFCRSSIGKQSFAMGKIQQTQNLKNAAVIRLI